jgi:hypothetical protein
MLKFLNRLVVNAKFNIEDICSIYRRLKIDAGDDSDTLSYIQFMTSILPPAEPLSPSVQASLRNSPRAMAVLEP